MLKLFAAALLLAAPAAAVRADTPAPLDYAKAEMWVCWPGAKVNACEIDLTTTVVKADGATSVEPFKADPKPPIDCFYIYPTVSNDPGVLANAAVEPEEQMVVKQQLARFASVCRIYAPVYRQFTLTALRAAMTGTPLPGSLPRPTTPYDDSVAAWKYYLAHENHGRGVVLIGHSQGSGVLTQLIKNEIDGKPVQKQIVSALLLGTRLTVPAGKDVGGDFQSMPLCHSPQQTGCAVAYASFRADSPPPANSRFGKATSTAPGMEAACVNPAALGGGEGELHSYLASGNEAIAATASRSPDWLPGTKITTPFVSVPGMLWASCVNKDGFNYLAIRIDGGSGPRTKTISGDVMVGNVILKDWGLHLIDANLAMGNLIDLVRSQGKAWMAAKR
jgi:Protein of unknown function (DUF3089)